MGQVAKISEEALKTKITAKKKVINGEVPFFDTKHIQVVPPKQNTPPAMGFDTALMNGPQQRMVNALAWAESVGITQMDKTQLALFSDQSPKSSAFSNNLGALRTSGWVAYPSKGLVTFTDEGRKVAQVGDGPTTDTELHSMLFNKLPKPQVAMLQVLIQSYPNAVSKEEISEITGASLTSSAFSNNLGRLRSLKLIDYPAQGMVVALPVLFIE
jgi:hypothetical protein